MDVASPELRRQAIAASVEQQQRVKAGLPISSRISRARPAKFSSFTSISVSKVCNRDVSAARRPESPRVSQGG